MSCRGNSVALCSFTAVLVFCLVFPCLAKEPHSARDYFERGLSRAHAGDSYGAIEDFTNAIVLNSNMNTRALKRMRHRKSELENGGQPDLHDRFLVIDKFNALAYYNRGNLLMDQGRLNEAINDFDRAIALDPHFSRAFNNRGHVKYRTGDIDGATKDYNRSVQLDPRNAVTYLYRGIFRHEIRDFVGAIADYTHAIKIDPHMAAACNERGRAYLVQARLDEAYRDFDRAIELNPSLFTAYLNRGLTLILQGKDAEAEADFAHYLQFAGDQKDTLERIVRKARESRLANGAQVSGNLRVIAP